MADCKNAWWRFAWYASMLSLDDPFAVEFGAFDGTPRPETVKSNPIRTIFMYNENNDNDNNNNNDNDNN